MYLDPAFGSMLVQVLVAIAATCGVLAFSLRRKIMSFFSKKKKTSDTNGAKTDELKSDNNKADDVIDMLSDEAAEGKTDDVIDMLPDEAINNENISPNESETEED